MKTYLTAAIAGLALVSTAIPRASAQSSILLDDPANHSYFGVRAGLDISSPSPDIFKNGAGVNLGVVFNLKIVKNFYIEPGASLYYDTWSLRPERLDMRGPVSPVRVPDAQRIPSFSPGRTTTLSGVEPFDNSFRNFGIRIPIMLGYHFDFTPTVNVAVFTGPELSIGLRNRFHYNCGQPTAAYPSSGEINCYLPGAEEPGDSQIDKILYYMQDIFKRVDCAWKIGVGVNYDNFHISVGGAIGMTNVYKHHNASAFSDDAFRMNRLTVTVGYNF